MNLFLNHLDDNQLRDYQKINKLKIYDSWNEFKSVMLQMPTGTGKTRLFASIVKDIHNQSIENKKAFKVLILAHRQELIRQISENIGVRYGIAHGKIMSKNWEEEFYPTQVASIQTLIRRLEKWENKNFDFIIIDEAHHALAPTYIKICETFPEAKILGVTATPYRLGKGSFKKMFDSLIVSSSISEFIKNGYLSDYEYYSIKPNSKIQNLIDEINDFDFDGDYAEKALSKTFDKDKIRANLLDTYFKYASGKKGIIYTINKAHNEHVCKMFVNAGIIASAIDSDTGSDERNRIVRDFKNGNIQVLCNVNIFSEGFDCPDVEFIQLARPTKSLSMYLQQVGRGFRIHEDKDKVIFLDNVGLYNRFGLPSANRKWQSHFEGNNNDDEYKPEINFNENIRYIELEPEIEEGNEKVELIFSTNKENNNSFDRMDDFHLYLYEKENIDLNNIMKIDDYIFIMMHYYDNEDDINFYDFLNEEYDEYFNEESHFNKYDYIKKVFSNGKCGILNERESKLLLEPIHDEINYINIFGHVIFSKNGKKGIYNVFLEEIEVEPIFHEIITVKFSPNYYIVELDGKQGIISKYNKLYLEPSYESVIEVYDYFNLETENEWKFCDSTLNIINHEKFTKVEKFGEYIIVNYNNLFGFSYNDLLLFPLLIESFEIVSKNRIIIKYHRKGSCVLDENLNFIINPNSYNSISKITNKNYFITKTSSLYGVYNFDGLLILPNKYHSIEMVSNHFIVRENNKWKSISITGIEVFSSNKKKQVLQKIKNLNVSETEVIQIKIENKEQKNHTIIPPYKEIYKDMLSMYDNVNKIIRINKLKSEFKLTNNDIEDVFFKVGLYFDNPNIKLTEAEYHYFINVMEYVKEK